jgi:hypothetical protein
MAAPAVAAINTPKTNVRNLEVIRSLSFLNALIVV